MHHAGVEATTAHSADRVLYADRAEDCLSGSSRHSISIHANTVKTYASHAQGRTGLPGTCQAGRLVRRPGGPPGQMLKEGEERRRGPGNP